MTETVHPIATDDNRIESYRPVLSPWQLVTQTPPSDQAIATVQTARKNIKDILTRKDDRLLVVVGPCSIHDVDAAREYSEFIRLMRSEYADTLEVVMRTYFEKPRTTVGWKGLVYDPHRNGSNDMNTGLRLARSLLEDLNRQGIPTATEFLDVITPQYIADLISWGAIGARTTESQLHRELVSGLSCPVGFKNGTGGSVQLAVDAIGSSRHPHSFLSTTKEGVLALVSTRGNSDTHVILRGSSKGTNYDPESVASAVSALEKAGHTPNVMIDFSHANSQKQHKKQIEVSANVAAQIASGNRHIIGAMIESHLVEGNQSDKAQPLVYGKSITDACINTEDTRVLLGGLSE